MAEPAVRAAGPDALSARSSRQGSAILGDTSILGDNMEGAEGAYRDYAGGATTLNDTQEKAIASLTAATLSRRLPVLNIQYGETFSGVVGLGVLAFTALLGGCTTRRTQECTGVVLAVALVRMLPVLDTFSMRRRFFTNSICSPPCKEEHLW